MASENPSNRGDGRVSRVIAAVQKDLNFFRVHVICFILVSEILVQIIRSLIIDTFDPVSNHLCGQYQLPDQLCRLSLFSGQRYHYNWIGNSRLEQAQWFPAGLPVRLLCIWSDGEHYKFALIPS